MALTRRCAAYRFALDHLVGQSRKGLPPTQTSCSRKLPQRIAANQVVPLPRFAAVSGKL
jgi:hypothetical protein